MITYEEAKAGILNAWTDMDQRSWQLQDLLDWSLSAGDNDPLNPALLPAFVRAIELSGWTVGTDPLDPLWADLPADTQGLTHGCHRKILVREGIPMARLFRVLAHEVGHAWGTITDGNRICREHGKNATPEQMKARFVDDFLSDMYGEYATWKVENEAEAELTALIVCSAVGGLTPAPAFYYLGFHRQKCRRGQEHFDAVILPRAWASAQQVAARVLEVLEDVREAA